MPLSPLWLRSALVFLGCLLGGGVVGFAWLQSASDGEPRQGLFPPANLDLLFGPPETSAAERELVALDQKLRRRITVEADMTPLTDVLQMFEREMGLQLLIDPEGLEEAGVTSDQLVSIKYRQLEGRHALKLMLEPLHLAYVKKDGVVQVTSEEKCGEQLCTRMYNIRDLVDSAWARKPEPESKGAATPVPDASDPFGPQFSLPPQRKKARWEVAADEIVEILETTVAPHSWCNNGGMGSITVYRGMLVVNQTETGHDEVDSLLRQLRRVECCPSGAVLAVP